MRVLFINRGYPGLGRVMGSVALDSIFKNSAIFRNYESAFASYLSGYTYLEKSNFHPINLFPDGYFYRPNAFCIPFGVEGRSFVKLVGSFSPDFVVIDGEPLFIDWLYDMLQIPVLVITNPSDLYNPACDDMAIDFFRYYYSKAHAVIAHGIWRLPDHLTNLGNRAGNVVEMNTIVHHKIFEAGFQRRIGNNKPSCGRKIVGVLGGGSENVASSYRSHSLQLAKWLVEACDCVEIEKLTLYCSDKNVYKCLVEECHPRFPCNFIADQMDNISDIIEADLIVGRAGRNLVSEVLTLGSRALLVAVAAENYRTGDQKETAEVATKTSRAIRRMSINAGYEQFQRSFQQLVDLQPSIPGWIPGNEVFIKFVPELLARLGLLNTSSNGAILPK